MLSSHKSCHGLGNWYHQTGSHDFHFSITSHPEGWKNGYAPALEENHPLYPVIKKTASSEKPSSSSLLSISDPFVSLCTMKQADNVENAVVLRIVEMEGVDKDVEIVLPFDAISIQACNMVEETGAAEALPVSVNTLKLHIGHNSIDTYLIRYK